MTTTASVYYNKIDINYPSAGRDNDSQGFRDNFNNIKLALTETDNALSEINLGLVKTSNLVTNFDYNTIKRANFQDCSQNVYDDFALNGVRKESVSVNYSLGSYQKFVVGTDINFNIINWPNRNDDPIGLHGSIILSITPSGSSNPVITFTGAIPVGSTSIPFTFAGTTTAFFELWSDDSGDTVYINQIGYKDGVVGTGTSLVATNTIKIGTNTYKTGTNFSTIVTTDAEGDKKSAEIALLKHVIKTTIHPLSASGWGEPSTSTFYVESGIDSILAGATINFTGSNITYIVAEPGFDDGITTKIVTTVPIDLTPTPPADIGDYVYFANPIFADTPITVTFSTSTVSSTVGTAGDYKGTIYANGSELYVAYEDYGTTASNWLKVYGSNYIDSIDTVNTARPLASGTTAQTPSVYTDDQTVATTEFVHNIMPYGAIIMWWGNTGAIPDGWTLCDGSSGTPDLRNRFVIGAFDSSGSTTVTGSPTTTGGSKDASVVSHTHSVSGTTQSSGDHQHAVDYPLDCTTARQQFGTTNGDTDSFCDTNGIASGNVVPLSSIAGAHTHSFSGTTGATGDSGTNANLPPYYALCYIMKVI